MAATLLDASAYSVGNDIARISVPKLAPNQLIESPSSGTTTVGADSTITVLAGINGTNSTIPSADQNLDILWFAFRPPINSTGQPVDALVSMKVGGVPIQTLQLNATDGECFFPLPERLGGGVAAAVPLGKSTLLALQLADLIQRGQVDRGALPPNIPLEITGVKVPPNTPVTVTVISAAGWGQAGPAFQPLEIYLLGDIVRSSVVAAYDYVYPAIAAFDLSRPPYGRIQGMHELPGRASEHWGALPGGAQQQGKVVIAPSFVDAVNAVAIDPALQRVVYSNQTALGGVQNNVTFLSNPSLHTEADLGDLAGTAFVWKYLGFTFDASLQVAGSNPEMYVGLRLNDNETLPGNANGRRVSMRNNPFAYGRQYPQGPDGARYVALPDVRLFGQVLSAGLGIAPQVSTQGLAALAAQTVHVAKGGVAVQGAGVNLS